MASIEMRSVAVRGFTTSVSLFVTVSATPLALALSAWTLSRVSWCCLLFVVLVVVRQRFRRVPIRVD
jgi:hypothetical protein